MERGLKVPGEKKFCKLVCIGEGGGAEIGREPLSNLQQRIQEVFWEKDSSCVMLGCCIGKESNIIPALESKEMRGSLQKT